MKAVRVPSGEKAGARSTFPGSGVKLVAWPSPILLI